MRGTVPVFFRRSVRTASGLPQRVSQRGNVLVPEGRDTVFIHRFPVHLPCILVSLLGVFEISRGALVSGLVVLFLMSLRGTIMSVRGNIVQLRGSLVIFVV